VSGQLHAPAALPLGKEKQKKPRTAALARTTDMSNRYHGETPNRTTFLQIRATGKWKCRGGTGLSGLNLDLTERHALPSSGILEAGFNWYQE
jgi:hypothetical protein